MYAADLPRAVLASSKLNQIVEDERRLPHAEKYHHQNVGDPASVEWLHDIEDDCSKEKESTSRCEPCPLTTPLTSQSCKLDEQHGGGVAEADGQDVLVHKRRRENREVHRQKSVLPKELKQGEERRGVGGGGVKAGSRERRGEGGGG